MNIIQRSLKTIDRNLFHSFLSFTLFFLLIISTIVTLNVLNALERTENHFNQVTANQVFITQINDSGMSLDELERIEALPFVNYGQFGLSTGIRSENLRRYYRQTDRVRQVYADCLMEFGMCSFGIEGLSLINDEKLRQRHFALSEGRLITEQEVDEGAPVIFVTEAFAQLNDINIGDYLQLELMIVDAHMRTELFWQIDDVIDRLPFQMEVVGILEFIEEVSYPTIAPVVSQHYNIILTSNRFISEIIEHSQALYEANYTEEQLQSFQELNLLPTPHIYQATFFLDDFRNFNLFYEEAQNILNNAATIQHMGWFGLEHLNLQINEIFGMFQYFLIYILLAGLALISILMIFYIKRRTNEIGILIALGESKFKIILQLIVENTLNFGLALILAIIPSLWIGRMISRFFFISNLDLVTAYENQAHSLVMYFNTVTIDMLTDFYEVNFTLSTVLLSILISLIFISMIIATISAIILRTSPAKLLVSHK